MRLFLPTAFAVLAAALPAHAAPLYYSFSGTEVNGAKDTLSFTVPNPAASLLGFGSFTVNTTSLLFDGMALSSAAISLPYPLTRTTVDSRSTAANSALPSAAISSRA